MRGRSKRATSPCAPLIWVVLVAALACPAIAGAQGSAAPLPQPPPSAPPVSRLTMDEAVRLAIDRNQALRAQRQTIDMARADEISADIKPNPTFSFSASGVPVFSPSQLTFNTFHNAVAYDAGLSYTFERGGKRDKREIVAQDATDVAIKSVLDAERQVRFQTQQAFIGLLLAKSALQLAQDNLKNFQQVVDMNRQRVTSGDLAQGDLLMITLQQLQFETDVSAAEVGLVQSQAALRQLVGYETVTENFDVVGELAYHAYTVTLVDLQREALASRPDLLAAQGSLRMAQAQATSERGNGASDIVGSADYLRAGSSNTFAFGVSFDLQFYNHNQGNIAHADAGVRQATELEAGARFGVATDVISAFAGYQTNEKIVKLYESGYLDQSKQSLDISSYAYQRGSASLLNLLDAERTYRATQLAYRQALSAYLSSVEQINFVVGKQVMR